MISHSPLFIFLSIFLFPFFKKFLSIFEKCWGYLFFKNRESLFKRKNTLKILLWWDFEKRKNAVVQTTAIAIPLHSTLIMFTRDAHRNAMIFSTTCFETMHTPKFRKKGSSFFEDPAYFVFSESVFFCYHARGLWPTCSSFLLLLF